MEEVAEANLADACYEVEQNVGTALAGQAGARPSTAGINVRSGKVTPEIMGG